MEVIHFFPRKFHLNRPKNVTGLEPRTTQFLNEHLTNWKYNNPHLFNIKYVKELSGSGFESSYSHLTFRFCTCFEFLDIQETQEHKNIQSDIESSEKMLLPNVIKLSLTGHKSNVEEQQQRYNEIPQTLHMIQAMAKLMTIIN